MDTAQMNNQFVREVGKLITYFSDFSGVGKDLRKEAAACTKEAERLEAALGNVKTLKQAAQVLEDAEAAADKLLALGTAKANKVIRDAETSIAASQSDWGRKSQGFQAKEHRINRDGASNAAVKAQNDEDRAKLNAEREKFETEKDETTARLGAMERDLISREFRTRAIEDWKAGAPS